MTAALRRGACPALSAPMQTGDGLLVRLNTVDGGLTPKALIGLAEAAARHGNGMMEVTARGNLQIRGLTAQSAPRLEVEIGALGILVRAGMPVETGPLAGLDPGEVADPIPLAARLRLAIEAVGLGARLGPKVSVVIDGGGAIGLDGISADVRLVAVRAGADVRWAVSVGGDSTSARSVAVLSEESAFEAAMTILAEVAGLGEAGRGRDLPASAFNRRGATSGERAIPEAKQDTIGKPEVYPLHGACFAVPVYLPFGSIGAEAIAALARSVGQLEGAVIRLAPERALLLCGLPARACGPVRDTAAKLGFVTVRRDPRLRIATCPGAPACASGRVAARALAADIAASCGDIFDKSMNIHVSGCAKGCARPSPASITLVGGEVGVGISLGTTARGVALSYTPPERAARGFEQVAGLLRAERKVSETFGDCLARLGAARVSAAFGQE